MVEQSFYQLAILNDCGVNAGRILDLGCGSGKFVQSLIDAGYDAYGCDVSPKHNPSASLLHEGRIRLSSAADYQLPFDDGYFDAVISNQVFEHVADLESTLSEIHRVLRPGGMSLNLFPSRYRVIEPHVRVPGATLIRNKPWLWFWDVLGFRKPGFAGRSRRDVVAVNLNYLEGRTFYRRKKDLREISSRYFVKVQFREDLFLKNSPNKRGRSLYAVAKALPFLFAVYRTFQSTVLVMAK